MNKYQCEYYTSAISTGESKKMISPSLYLVTGRVKGNGKRVVDGEVKGRTWVGGRAACSGPAKRERKLDDISRNDQILLPIERGKFAVHLPREITDDEEVS